MKLGKEHRIECEPIYIELVDDYEYKPKINHACPRSVHTNLRKPASDQIKELLDAGIIEECK